MNNKLMLLWHDLNYVPHIQIASTKLTTIWSSAFDATIISEIFIPKSVTTIGISALISSYIEKVTIENGRTLDISKVTVWGI